VPAPEPSAAATAGRSIAVHSFMIASRCWAASPGLPTLGRVPELSAISPPSISPDQGCDAAMVVVVDEGVGLAKWGQGWELPILGWSLITVWAQGWSAWPCPRCR